MRRKLRIRLVRGSVAVLGLCLGGVGCQSSGPLIHLPEGNLAAASGAELLPDGSAEVAGQPLGMPTTAALAQATPAEAASSRPIFHRLLRPTPVRETPSVTASQTTPAAATPQRAIIASSWSPVLRDNQPAPGQLAMAGWQPGQDKLLPLPAGAPEAQLDPPTKVKPGVTAPPGLDKPTKPMAEPESTLPAPKSLPAEPGAVIITPGPEAVQVPPTGHVLPHAPSAPHELGKVSLPAYIIEAPDILLVETLAGEKIQKVQGQHLVRPDGTIGLGVYGSVYVAGMTIDQAREAVAQAIASRLDPKMLAKKEIEAPQAKDINIDVIAYNSKVYYVITDGGGYGVQVRRFPVTGSETVLDAISLIDGLPAVASKKKIWVARRTQGDHAPPQILPVDWLGISQGARVVTNYQVMPGDRIYVHSEGLIRLDSKIGKFLSPFERILGSVLLGSSTVNSISGRGAFGNNSGR